MGGLPADDWSAIAAWATTALVLLGGVVAWLQVRHARQLREEQAAPYVVVFLELVRQTDWIYDIVIKNLGATPATDVRVTVTPAPQMSSPSGSSDPISIPKVIPVLVPGQAWHTLWDMGPSRVKTNLPDLHEASVSFLNAQREEQPPLHYVLDWTPEKERLAASTYGEHDAAKALREISKTLKGWQEGTNGGLRVTARDGDAKDARLWDGVVEPDAASTADEPD